MKPDYNLSARKAAEIIGRYNSSDPMTVLEQISNVLLLSCGVSSDDQNPVYVNLDAMTIASGSAGNEKYIVIYNPNASPVRLRFALARELGHIVLGHDDSSPEDVREEEAGCFAHFFLCPLTLPGKSVKIYFRPKHRNQLWELKSIMDFESMEKMKMFVAEENNKYNRFIGNKTDTKPHDVKLTERAEVDILTGWKNCYNVELNGKTVGYCGE